MPLTESYHEFLKPLETSQGSDEAGLSPGILDRLEWVAGQLRNNLEHVVLFTGATGAGKTLSASLLASHLDYPLYRVDLARVVSKYIGETEKNLSLLLQADSTQQAVLLFDEADALLGRRSDIDSASEAYSNMTTSHLLQLVETAAGIVILATNLDKNLDADLLRRVKLVVDFSQPYTPRRQSWWQRVSAVVRRLFSK